MRLRGLLVKRRRPAGDAFAETGEKADESTAGDLHTPPGAVSVHEHAPITVQLDGWVTALAVRRGARPFPPPVC
jgi:hypothetical protein